MKTLKIWFNAMVFILLIMGGMISTEIFSKPIYSYWLGICIGIFLTIASIMV